LLGIDLRPFARLNEKLGEIAIEAVWTASYSFMAAAQDAFEGMLGDEIGHRLNRSGSLPLSTRRDGGMDLIARSFSARRQRRGRALAQHIGSLARPGIFRRRREMRPSTFPFNPLGRTAE
jgi:hypothetical protein